MRILVLCTFMSSVALASAPTSSVAARVGSSASHPGGGNAASMLRRVGLVPRNGQPSSPSAVSIVHANLAPADVSHPFSPSPSPYDASARASLTQQTITAQYRDAKLSPGADQNRVKRVLRTLEKTSSRAGAPSLADQIRGTMVVGGGPPGSMSRSINAESLANGTIVVNRPDLKDAKAVGRLVSTHPTTDGFVEGLLAYAASGHLPKQGDPVVSHRTAKGVLSLLVGHEATHSFNSDAAQPRHDPIGQATHQVTVEARADAGGVDLSVAAGMSVSGVLGQFAVSLAHDVVANAPTGGTAIHTLFEQKTDGDHPSSYLRYRDAYNQIAARTDLSPLQKQELASMPTPQNLGQAVLARLQAGTVPTKRWTGPLPVWH